MQKHFRIVSASVLGIAVLSVVLAAHMKVEKTEPANGATLATPPPHVQLWLTQKPDMKVTKVDLAGPSGKVTLGPPHTMSDKTLMAAVTGKMADGKYTVNWQTAGDDGHVQKGSFTFTVKHAAE
jgi:methionine-rich copper-binding protein CopC